MNMMEICSSMALEWLSKLHVDQCEQRIWGGGEEGAVTQLHKYLQVYLRKAKTSQTYKAVTEKVRVKK